MAAVLGVSGLAFEARIAAGRDTRVMCSGDGRTLSTALARAVSGDCRGLVSFGVGGGLVPQLLRSMMKDPSELPMLLQTALDALIGLVALLGCRQFLGPSFLLPD